MKTLFSLNRTLPLIILCSGAVASVPANAQETTTTSTTTTTTDDKPTSDPGFGSAFGVKGGANWSNLWVKDVNDENPRFGFNVGLFARFVEPGSLGFQLEALYDQKGTKITKSSGTVTEDYTYKFDYITVPGMVVIPLGDVFELHAGAYAAYMVISEIRTSGDLPYDGTTDPANSKFNGFDYGLVGGAAINLGERAQIGIRYEHGLNDLANNDISHDVLGSSKNSTLQGYLAIALGK